MALSGGWGGRGQGLGLLACVTGTVEGEAQVGGREYWFDATYSITISCAVARKGAPLFFVLLSFCSAIVVVGEPRAAKRPGDIDPGRR